MARKIKDPSPSPGAGRRTGKIPTFRGKPSKKRRPSKPSPEAPLGRTTKGVPFKRWERPKPQNIPSERDILSQLQSWLSKAQGALGTDKSFNITAVEELPYKERAKAKLGFVSQFTFGGGTRGLSIVAKGTKWGVGSIGGFIMKNTKTQSLATQALSRVFSAKTLAILGTAAGTVFLGKWGQAEAPEGLNIIMRDALKQAERTGNWEIYNEAKAARDEITDLSMWEKIGLWTPGVSAVIGISQKIAGVVGAGVVMDKVAEDTQIQQETGEDDKAYWERVNQEKIDNEIRLTNYYNNQRLLTEQRILDIREQQNKAAAGARRAELEAEGAFWLEHKKKMMKLEEKEREAIAAFWLAYYKEKEKLRMEMSPSKLNFGLL